MDKLFIISVGGSLIVPEEVDARFLKHFKQLIAKYTRKGHRFVLIAGGGKTCRKYQSALRLVNRPKDSDLDWMGIYATWLNAHLLQLIFGPLSHKNIVSDPNKRVDFREKILIAGGWAPGRSTDDDAVRLAKIYGAATIINLSNIDYVYTGDPRKDKTAQPIKNISWKDFRKNIVGKKRIPGGNYPFDPTAAQGAEQNRMRVIIANGKNLKNLERIFLNKPFTGTIIE